MNYLRQKSIHTSEILDASAEFIIDFLIWKNPNANKENWLNYHIDHIRPLSSFPNIETDERQQQEAFGWRNLQLLSPYENLTKNDRRDYEMEDYHKKLTLIYLTLEEEKLF